MLKLILYLLASTLIEQLKQPSPSVNPHNQLLSNLGKRLLSIKVTGSNLILPLVTQSLNPLIKRYNLFFLVGKRVLALKRLIMISISLLLCVTYLLVFAD
jgi:hypothetical protein